MAFTAYHPHIVWILPNGESLYPRNEHRFLLLKTTVPITPAGVPMTETRSRTMQVLGSVLQHIQDFAGVLSDMEIPEIVQLLILQHIGYCARRGYSSANFLVNIWIVRYQRYDLDDDGDIPEAVDDGGDHIVEAANDDDDDIDEAVDDDGNIAEAQRESMELVEVRTLPAMREFIDALERLVFDGLGSPMDCMVCMEEIKAGKEAIRLPCSHLYHANCIVKWLKTCHICPICRFQVPFAFL